MVTALLVSHDGARWLPAVLDSLAAQSRPVDRLVAVDTGSTDESPALLRTALGEDRVLDAPARTSFGAAVQTALDTLPAFPADEWLWLLHDDAAPAPDALEALLAAAAEHPEASVLGPKLREWPSLRRLLEVGVTLSGTGRRETSLERGEYDQGQHDEVREVLAVNTAGMLIRRRVWEDLGGLDPALPVFGNDLDLGWRAAAAGHTTLVVPQAVVFHVEAAHRGRRRTPLTGRHTHYQERRAALWTLLVNTRSAGLPWRVLRLACGSVLRALAFLLMRQVRTAGDELAALGSVYARPGAIRDARRHRAAQRSDDPTDRDRVRRLLAPWWVPYRHGLDGIGELVQAATSQAQDVAERRRTEARAADAGYAVESDEFRAYDGDGDEWDALPADSGWAARVVTSPVALAVLLFAVLAVLATWEAWGPVSGGALPPAPASSAAWWRLHTGAWHPLLQGTDVPAPPYLPVLAALGLLTGGSGPAVVSLLLVGSIPVAAWGAWRLLRVAGHLADPLGAPRWLLAWGATSYALLPATSGLWGGGRFGTVVAAALLPWLGHAALRFADPDPDHRWRAAWRTGLLLAVTTAFAPAVWVLAVLLGVLLVGVGLAVVGRVLVSGGVLLPPLVALLVPLVLLVPWWLPLVAQGRGSGLLLDPGSLPVPEIGATDLLTGVAGEYAAWFLPAVALLLLGLLALVPATTRVQVLLVWLVLLGAALTAALLSRIDLTLGSGTAGVGLGIFSVLLPGLAVVATVLAGTGPARQLVRGAVPRAVGAVAVAALVLVPAASLVWFTVAADDALAASADEGVPAYMEQESRAAVDRGVLVLQGTRDSGLDYTVRRGDGVRLGETEVQALTGEDAALTRILQDLLARPSPTLVARLADRGVEYVVLRSPADPDVAAILDAAPGLSQASTPDRATRAWQVDRDQASATGSAPDAAHPPNDLASRTWLLVLQGGALVVVLLLCLPGPAREEETR